MIKDIAFTIYAVTDMKKAKEFYEGILGLVPGKEFNSDQWTEYDLGSGTFALGCAPDQWKPSEDGAVVAFEVDDFDAAIQKLKDNNVEFKLEPQHFPTCSMAVVRDPDRNMITIHKKKQA
jgi:catechol 2,3-dioxygenase-like lactoylglutathione lyase family enzyme